MTRTKFVDQDEPIDGCGRVPSVLPFEYDAEGERQAIEEITARERLEASCRA